MFTKEINGQREKEGGRGRVREREGRDRAIMNEVVC